MAAPATKKHRILVVDDEIEACKMARQVLQPEFDVLTATSVEDARQIASGQDLLMAMVDYHMPKENGEVLINELMRTLPFDRIFLVTADKSKKPLGDAVTYLQKPYDPRILLRMADTIKLQVEKSSK